MSVAVIACGALAAHVHEIADRRNLTLRIEPINPMLHNRPEGIAPEVEKMILELQVLPASIFALQPLDFLLKSSF